MKRLGKKYVEASKKVDKNTYYNVKEAIKLVKETSITKFDSSIDIAINLNVDSKKNDQQLRGSLVLPNGSGKSQKVLVIADGEEAKKAIQAEADFVGGEEMIEKIVEGKLNKYFAEKCLLEQKWFKDESKTIASLLDETSQKMGEPLKISRIILWEMGKK